VASNCGQQRLPACANERVQRQILTAEMFIRREADVADAILHVSSPTRNNPTLGTPNYESMQIKT
jgi:hypothetical protein